MNYKVYTNAEDTDLILEAKNEIGYRKFTVFEKMSDLVNYCNENKIDVRIDDFVECKSNLDFQSRVLDALERIENKTSFSKEVLTIDEASAFLGYKKSYLYKLVSLREIPHYKNRGAIAFKREELDTWRTSLKVSTKQEINSKATLRTLGFKVG